MRKHLSNLICSALLLVGRGAQAEFVTAHSVSKQFVVHGRAFSTATEKQNIALDPSLLAVSCERIKQAVLSQLGERDYMSSGVLGSSAGKIYVVIQPRAGQRIVITPLTHFPQLAYRVDLPNQLEVPHLVEAITEAVLLERANRHAGPQNFTRIPRWLSQGILAQVQASTPEALVLQQNLHVMKTSVRKDASVQLRKNLQHYTPLTFEELSWPESLSRERAEYFNECAQLFVHELTRLKNGQECLRRTLEELPHALNWQTAFLRGFKPHFKHLVDVEKWWSLRLVNLNGRDARKLWPREESIDRVNAALSVPVHVHVAANRLPERREISLQEIITQWEPSQQKPTLQKVVSQLQALRLRVHPDCTVLLDDYRNVLENYLQRFEKSGFLKTLFSRDNADNFAEGIRGQLDRLDQRRQEIANQKPPTREDAIRTALEIAENPSATSSQ